jgi:hypothetical protein
MKLPIDLRPRSRAAVSTGCLPGAHAPGFTLSPALQAANHSFMIRNGPQQE